MVLREQIETAFNKRRTVESRCNLYNKRNKGRRKQPLRLVFENNIRSKKIYNDMIGYITFVKEN